MRGSADLELRPEAGGGSRVRCLEGARVLGFGKLRSTAGASFLAKRSRGGATSAKEQEDGVGRGKYRNKHLFDVGSLRNNQLIGK